MKIKEMSTINYVYSLGNKCRFLDRDHDMILMPEYHYVIVDGLVIIPMSNILEIQIIPESIKPTPLTEEEISLAIKLPDDKKKNAKRS